MVPLGMMEEISSMILAFSSGGNKLGIYPLLRMLHTSSTIDSLKICVSENRKTVGLCSKPATFITFWTSYTQYLEFTSLYSLMKAM